MSINENIINNIFNYIIKEEQESINPEKIWIYSTFPDKAVICRNERNAVVLCFFNQLIDEDIPDIFDSFLEEKLKNEEYEYICNNSCDKYTIEQTLDLLYYEFKDMIKTIRNPNKNYLLTSHDIKDQIKELFCI